MKILVMNSGSSSLKFQLFNFADLAVCASGVIEQIGDTEGLVKLKYFADRGDEQEFEARQPVPDHSGAIQLMTALFREKEIITHVRELAGVGHRVVHGGEAFQQPVLITPDVLEIIRELVPLAPLHNPANITGIEVVMEMVPEVPQVAVFDTAFHQSIPPHAYIYALPYEYFEKYRIRSYGFHGVAFRSVGVITHKVHNQHHKQCHNERCGVMPPRTPQHHSCTVQS